jgi:hypothetical protein
MKAMTISTEQPKQSPVVLEPATEVKIKSTEKFGDNPGTGCAKEYEDIIYVTAQRKFWLITKEVADQLEESAVLMSKRVAVTDRAERMQQLDKAGLMACFASPALSSFLDGQDKKRFDELDDQINKIESSNKSSLDTAKAQTDVVRRRIDIYEAENAANLSLRNDVLALAEERKQLENKGRKEALTKGYIEENGRLYSPREIKISGLIGTYCKYREASKKKAFTENDFFLKREAPIWELLTHYEKLLERTEKEKKVDGLLKEDISKRIEHLESVLAEYTKIILDLADLGIATPEFALNPESQRAGTLRFHDYMQLDKELDSTIKKIIADFEKWCAATGDRAVPPSSVFTENQNKYLEIQEKSRLMRQQAEKNLTAVKPYRLLLWDPQAYTPKPVDSLVKANIPLREVSMASSSKPLSHLSLMDLRAYANKGMYELLKNTKIKGIAKSDEDAAFTEYLVGKGCKSLEINTDWFDKGLFQPERLFKFLDKEHFKVKSIRSPSAQKPWGENLQAMIFEDDTLRQLALFDNSYAAMFVRMLGGGAAPSIHGRAEISGPKLKDKKLAGIEIGMEVSLARGEVDILDLKLPDPASIKPVTLEYISYKGEPKTLDLGEYYLEINAKAWGFVGASLILARDLKVSAEHGKLGISGSDDAIEKATETVKDASQDPAKPKETEPDVKLFLGAQVGCQVTGQLKWKPPVNIRPAPPVPGYARTNAWNTLAKLEVSVAGGAGASLHGAFSISMKDGRLRLNAKASLFFGLGATGSVSFEIDAKSISDWLRMIRTALIENDMHRLEWIDESAFSYLSKLSFLGIVTMGDVAFYAAQTEARVNQLYDSMTNGNRASLIGYSIASFPDKMGYKEWFAGLQPEAIGPLLHTLCSTPRGFKATDSSDTATAKSFDSTQAIMYQQQAIGFCIEWIAQSPTKQPFNAVIPNEAQRQFEEAVSRMNRHGLTSEEPKLDFCKNLYRLNKFMEEQTGKLGAERTTIDLRRAEYKKNVANLGQHINHLCSTTVESSPLGFISDAYNTTTTVYSGQK